MVDVKNKHKLPFKIVSSSVSGGYHETIENNFVPSVDIVNYHEDKYGDLGESPLQGPFSERWSGGHEHRHVDLNQGTDNAQNRREAWHIEFTGSNSLRIYGHNYRSSPPAYWTRQGLAKRPLNVTNIRTTTSSISHGNYEHDYQIVQTSGRKINNRYFVRNEGITLTSSASPYISGSDDFLLPDRAVTKNKFIFVNRFSAPGSPEASSRGTLDLDSEEYSVYNTLNERNLAVREPLNEWLTQHAGPRGLSSFTEDTGSWTTNNPVAAYHKTNRNRTYNGSESVTTNTILYQATWDDWTSETYQDQVLTSSNVTSSGRFGFEISMKDSNNIAVSAPTELSNQGRVYLYNKTGSYDWTLLETITGSVVTSSISASASGSAWTMVSSVGYFGVGVRYSGSYLIASAPQSTLTHYESSSFSSSVEIVNTVSASFTPVELSGSSFYGHDLEYDSNTGKLIVGHPRQDETFFGSFLLQSGRAHIYNVSGTVATLETIIYPSNPIYQTRDYFGHCVSISGAYCAISAPLSGSSNQGKVAVYKSGSGGWALEAELSRTSAASNEYLGGGVSSITAAPYESSYIKNVKICNNKLFAGAPGYSSGRGGVVVFNSSSTGWIQEDFLTSPNPSIGDNYGLVLSAYGNRVAISEPYQDIAGTSSGQYHIYNSSSATGWVREESITGSNASEEAGRTLELSGNMLLAGHPGQDKVMLYVSGSSGWYAGLQHVFTSGSGIGFGKQVAFLNQSSVVIQAEADYVVGSNTSGSITYYISGSSGWQERSKLTGSIGYFPHTGRDTFGSSLDGFGVQDNAFVIIGDPNADDPSDSNLTGSGVTYIYRTNAYTSSSMGSSFTSSSYSNVGVVYIFKSGSSGHEFEHVLTASNWGSGDYLGGDTSLTNAGPTYLDYYNGYVVVGAPASNNSFSNDGRAHIFYSASSDGWTEQAILYSPDIKAGSYYGNAVTIYSDFCAIGEPYRSTGSTNIGGVDIYRRSGATWSREERLNISQSSFPAYNQFVYGVSLDSSQDNLYVGTADTTAMGANINLNRVFIYNYSGSAWSLSGTLSSSDTLGSPDNAERNFGSSIYVENSSSLAIGAWNWENSLGTIGWGKVYIFKNIDGIWRETGNVQPSSSQQYLRTTFGFSTALTGTTLIVGKNEGGPTTYQGTVHTFNVSGTTTIQDISSSTTVTQYYKNDNWFVQRSIPATDLGYYWITSSAVTDRNTLRGYQKEISGSNRAGAYTDIVFVSSSQVRTS